MRLFTVACISAIALTARADGPVPATPRHVESADHRVAIDLPGDWQIETADPGIALLRLRVTTSDGTPFSLEVFHVPGFRDPRAQAFYERTTQPPRYDTKAPAEAFLDPTPHLILDAPRHESYTRKVWLYRVIDRNGLTVVVYCDPNSWPALKDGCFAATASLTSTIPEWPARPAGYQRSERDGYEYLVQPGVKDAAVASLHAAILDLEKKYAATHGPVPKPAWNRPIVVVSADRAGSAAAAGQGKIDEDCSASVNEGRLFVVPPRKDDRAWRALLAREAWQIFHAQCYSYLASSWLCAGERRLVHAETLLGRGLPSVPDSFVGDCLPSSVIPLERVLKEPAGADMENQATAYAALFHAGAKPWRDAFAAFLADLAATGDWEKAEKKDLLSLDQAKLQAAAQAYLKELKPVKTK